MALLRINATATGLRVHETSQSLSEHSDALAAQAGPAIIMVHGYKYAPMSRHHCPHQKIFSDNALGWPQKLGFGLGHPDEGSGIALGWYARGQLSKVHSRAASLGEHLATLVRRLRTESPARPVHVIAHSLGSEVALNALEHLRAHSIARMVLLTGASYHSRALRMLSTPAGRSVELLNVVSRENDLFDAAFEHLVCPSNAGDQAIGSGIFVRNAVNLQIDCAKTLSSLSALDLAVAPSAKRVCHWSAYERPGVMEVYRRFLRSPDKMKLQQLAALLPMQTTPRWSNFVTRKISTSTALPDRLPRSLHALAFAGRKSGEMTGKSKNEHAY